MREPQYLVMTADGSLHGYFTREILLIDLSMHRNEPVSLFRIRKSATKIEYVPTTEAELRGRVA